jgi:hypothetical protein
MYIPLLHAYLSRLITLQVACGAAVKQSAAEAVQCSTVECYVISFIAVSSACVQRLSAGCTVQLHTITLC